nr:fasciclin domain-containing protein [Opitutaceae bacterium]
APTVNGKALTLQADAMGVTVNGAKVIAADLIASNGVIHVVDTVILP